MDADVSARPAGRVAAMVSRAVSRRWALPPARNRVIVARDVPVPMADGVVLRADHYVPVTGRAAATVLIRTPYGRGGPSVLSGQLLAERGYHVLIQSVRGTFGSGGVFDAMRDEASDGQGTVAWLRRQAWFSGRLVTFGASYMGFVQWALALDPPPELVAMIVHVGPHDFSRSAYHRGAFDLYNFTGWCDLIAHQETTGPVRGLARMATADRRLHAALAGLPVIESGRRLLGDGAPWFEGWLEHPELSDPFWAPLNCGAALDRVTVPTLLVGGWQDLFIEQTLEQYRRLAGRGVPVRLLVGPWAHLDLGTKGGAAAAESLAWLDRYAAPEGPGAPGVPGVPGVPGAPRVPAGSGAGTTLAPERSVRVWMGGAGEWREIGDWPPPGGRQRWYLGPRGALGTQPPAGPDAPATGFRYDPADPTPSVGGAVMSLRAGTRDNRAVERRSDVLTFSSEPLSQPADIIGEVTAELSVTRNNPHADLFVRLCDVDPRGRSRNVCDGIVRLTGADPLSGITAVPLLGVAHRFRRGHRIRLQVSGGAHPRFARNPGTGQVDASPAALTPADYRIGVLGESTLLLPVVTAAGEPSAAGPLARSAVPGPA
ncbi:MAG: CocE/NonD family hydrolase [Streptosporangiaceae bacterium]